MAFGDTLAWAVAVSVVMNGGISEGEFGAGSGLTRGAERA